MEDERILSLFWERSEDAIRETERKYGGYCRGIAHRILQNMSDAEEVLNDTLMKAWNTIPPNRPDSLKAYVGMICRQLSFNVYKRKKKQRAFGEFALVLEELSECLSDKSTEGDVADRLHLTDCLNRFLAKLPEQTRDLFVRRYWYASSISELSADFSMKESAITMQLHRTRLALKDFLQGEGIDV